MDWDGCGRKRSNPTLRYYLSIFLEILWKTVALGGLVVSMLATGPKVRGFKPGRGRWILMVIKSAARRRSHVVDLRHVKETYEHDRCSSAKFSGYVSPPRGGVC
jgi:hypothetical protein